MLEVVIKRFLSSNEDGFTLVELMVVVAIIGVLSAIAVPNFKKYQAKSKTSEAKLQLSAAYTAQQSFYSDYDTYHVCLKYMGYNPTNEVAQRIYAVGFGSDGTVAAITGTCAAATGSGPSDIACINGADVQNAAGSCYIVNATSGETWFAAGKRTGSAAAITTFTAANVGITAATAAAVDTFKMAAVGVIDIAFAAATTASAFTIDEDKKMIQLRAGY
jgi:type IV pilus assembly protein PilA